MFHRKNISNIITNEISKENHNVINLMYKSTEIAPKVSYILQRHFKYIENVEMGDFNKLVLTFFERGHISHRATETSRKKGKY